MTTPLFSLLHATRGRPQKAVAAYKMWHERAFFNMRGQIEHIFSTDFDDETGSVLYDEMLAAFPDGNWHITANANKGSAEAWNNAYKASKGTILVQVSDDMEPPEKWDEKIASEVAMAPKVAPVVVAISDGHRKDKLMTTFICTRSYAEMKGEFIHPGYASVWSDDDATYRAWRDAQEGRAVLIDARHIVINHRHHYHDSKVPWDATYERQNAPKNYEQGERLFIQRNPEALKTMKEWKGIQ